MAAGRRGRAQGTVGASADGRGARDAPRLVGARVDGGLLAPAWVACAARAARVRRCARSWSITDACVMNATMRMAPWQVGHASGSTSKICCSRVAHRRDASVGASGHAGTIAGGPSARVGGLGARRWPLGLVGPVRQPFQRDGIPRTVPREARRERAIVLGHPKGPSHTAVCTWNPECGQVSMSAACSSSNSAKRTKSRSTARRNASVNRAVSWAGHETKVPSRRNPPSVTRRCRCRCGCPLAMPPALRGVKRME